MCVQGFSVDDSTTRDIDHLCSWSQSSEFPGTEHPAHLLRIAHAKHQNVRHGESLVPLVDGKAPGEVKLRDLLRGYLAADSNEVHVKGMQPFRKGQRDCS